MRLPAFASAVAAAGVLLAGGGDARAACDDAARWTSDAYLPLALVRGARIERDHGQCPVLGGQRDEGARFQAIDRWGRVTGEVAYAHEASRGDFIRLLSGTRGVGVYVRGAWRPPASAALDAPAPVRAAFERWLGKRERVREVQFFRAGAAGAPEMLAFAVTRSTVTVAYAEGNRWHRAFRESYGPEAGWPLYALRAIVDMNGDGLPEVVYHFNEYEDGRGYEVTLAARRGGRSYEQVTDNRDDGP